MYIAISVKKTSNQNIYINYYNMNCYLYKFLNFRFSTISPENKITLKRQKEVILEYSKVD